MGCSCSADSRGCFGVSMPGWQRLVRTFFNSASRCLGLLSASSQCPAARSLFHDLWLLQSWVSFRPCGWPSVWQRAEGSSGSLSSAPCSWTVFFWLHILGKPGQLQCFQFSLHEQKGGYFSMAKQVLVTCQECFRFSAAPWSQYL